MTKNWGTRIEDAWNNLRPVTQELLEGTLKRGKKLSRKQHFSYDARADRELGDLLSALEKESAAKSGSETERASMRELADACAAVLEEKTSSADIFVLLAKRTLKQADFARFDKLADILLLRFPISEVAEVFRQSEVPQIRAIAFETLLVSPVPAIVALIRDPLYFEIGCNVLEQQYMEFDNYEAMRALESMSPKFEY